MRLIEFKDHFPNEKACEQHWRNERESVGITCKKCLKGAHYWIEGKSMWQCKDRNCKFRTSLKSGTVMENSNLSISIWYIAMHLMTSSKNNISALELQRQLMHSFKKVPISLQKSKHSKNTIPKFLKMKVLYKIDSLEINDMMKTQIEKKAKNTAYKDLEMDYESHKPHNTKKVEITKVLPWVHTAITNMKGAIYNVYKGITEPYMQNYMDEFCFKFNRRYFGTNIFDRLVISAVSYRWN
ncbi:MAG: transposase [Crocinitomicaceae bacterium]|nr:transposase [Crocinitomicaceae bacterium]